MSEGLNMEEFGRYLICAASGGLFGLAMEKARIHEPAVIRGQMDFSKLVMLKMFISATATGMIIMGAMSLVNKTNERFQQARAVFASGIVPDKGILTAVIGGSTVGAGIAISGACPGMLFPQLGALTQNSLYTLVGCFLGAFTYGVVQRKIEGSMKPAESYRYECVDKWADINYSTLAIPLGVGMLLFSYTLEYVSAWNNEVKATDGGSVFKMTAWLPQVSGALVGCLQLPLIMTLSRTLATSLSYCTALSPFLFTDNLRQACPYIASKKQGINNWWQVSFAGGSIIGAFLSALASGSLGPSSPVTPLEAIIGGFLMLFGSRMAGGCTSSHGVSGCGLLMLNSMIVTASIFGGGIAIKLAMNTMS